MLSTIPNCGAFYFLQRELYDLDSSVLLEISSLFIKGMKSSAFLPLAFDL